MKRYKELLQRLDEGEYTPGHYHSDTMIGGRTRGAHTDLGAYRIELDEIVSRINAFIREYTSREFLDPTYLRAQLKSKLNLVGLDFEYDTKQRIGEGSYSYQLKRFGGSFGTTPTHDLLKDGFLESDMIEEFAGSKMLLSFVVSKNESSMFDIDAKIVPGNAG